MDKIIKQLKIQGRNLHLAFVLGLETASELVLQIYLYVDNNRKKYGTLQLNRFAKLPVLPQKKPNTYLIGYYVIGYQAKIFDRILCGHGVKMKLNPHRPLHSRGDILGIPRAKFLEKLDICNNKHTAVRNTYSELREFFTSASCKFCVENFGHQEFSEFSPLQKTKFILDTKFYKF